MVIELFVMIMLFFIVIAFKSSDCVIYFDGCLIC